MTLALEWLQRSLGYRFVDETLMAAALTHRSAGSGHNERLEFLGDSVINCVVARLLYRAFPRADEGELSRRRANLVSGETLAQIAAEIGLGEYLKLGSGEQKAGGFRRASILADSLEAVFGAIFTEAGFEAAATAVALLIEPRLVSPAPAESLKDPKTRLQELLQARGMPVPVYSLVSVSGDPHEQHFNVRCEVDCLDLQADGEGASRRRAEQQAALHLLNHWNLTRAAKTL
jgi:ribonuclease III